MTPLSAICKSRNGEPGNGMRAMMGMQGGNAGNQAGNDGNRGGNAGTWGWE